MYLLSRLQRYAGIGRLVSFVIGRALSNGSSVRFTQMFLVLFKGLRNAMYLPSGEISAPEISGSPKKSSRSIIGGCCATADTAKNADANKSFTRIRMKMSPVFNERDGGMLRCQVGVGVTDCNA